MGSGLLARPAAELSAAATQKRIWMDDDGCICNAYTIAQADQCNVLSLGSLKDYGFEESMDELNRRRVVQLTEFARSQAAR